MTHTFASGFACVLAVFGGVALSVMGGCAGKANGDNSADASDGSSGSNLTWYATCGDPLCGVPGSDAGLRDDSGAPCPAIGTSCSMQGQQCGTHNSAVNCGAVEQCDSQDPTRKPGGCPISSRKFKDGIAYVDGPGLRELHDETLRMRLATYNYKAPYDDPNPKHLGFIIEDNPPQSPAVDWSHERVDLYGYLSMVVATMQVQETEIAELRRELDHARQGVCEALVRSDAR